jgi:hypothetical protein
MILIAVIYLATLYCVLKRNRNYPSGIFVLANAYDLFLTLPSALLFYISNRRQSWIDYGNYHLAPSLYIGFFVFQALSILVSLLSYRRGFRKRWLNPAKYFLGVDSSRNSYAWLTGLFAVTAILTLGYVHSAFGFVFITQPRSLYEASRDGFGSQYFVLGLMLRLAALMVLMSVFRHRRPIFVALFVFSIFTGAKVNTYIIVMMYVAYLVVFHWKGNIPIKMLLKLLVAATPIIWILIALTFQGTQVNLFELLVDYINEPWNNFVLLVQTHGQYFHGFFGGLLTWEDNLISRIPRPLFPGKPYLFGGFRLADAYFPSSIGIPSFGAEGIVYADWSFAGLVLLMLMKAMCSWLLGKTTATLLQATEARSIGFIYFGLVIVLSNFYFFTLPPANTLIDNLLVIYVLALTVGIRVRRSYNLSLLSG